jgi:hypothetical protein
MAYYSSDYSLKKILGSIGIVALQGVIGGFILDSNRINTVSL